eukprot:comp19204_c0_seq1/m.21933 comp19204_c0_seq1/g.21933  ORF comp19204_c0_seq1/g.21933 comp19204_c0_seq1/m.21933 type:complete len:331 (-) comp19204_c0_seq1:108-1100(-)
MEQEWSANPFQDPSVQAVGGTTRNVTTISSGVTATDEYNPFAPPTSAARTAPRVAPASTAVNVPSAPASKPTPTGATFSALADREAEIQRREDELRQKQAELDAKEAELARKSGKANQVPNWPPFPAWMPPPFKPWIHHSISEDIPSDNQVTMRNMFGLWYYHCFCYVVNVVAAIAGTACDTCDSTSTNVIIAVVFMCIATPASFKMWYRILYNGLKKDRAVNFMIFFFVFGFQILANFYFTLGFQGTGACGWISAIVAMSNHAAIGIFYIISAVAWTVNTAACVYMIIKIHSWYKGTDYTLDRAQSELATDAAKNPTIQDTVIRTAFSS